MYKKPGKMKKQTDNYLKIEKAILMLKISVNWFINWFNMKDKLDLTLL